MSIWLPVLVLLSIIFVVISTVRWRLHPFLALIFASYLFGLLSGTKFPEIVKSIADGFGGTLSSIGIVIAAGTIIGTFLEKSGGVLSLAEFVLKITKRKNVPLAVDIIGYMTAIPMVCDSGFIILSPLNRVLTKRAKLSLSTTAIALSLGLYATHTMPPTPGPVAAAGILGADLGLTIILGFLASIPAVVVGWLFSIKVASKIHIEPDEELTDEGIEERLKEAPSVFKSLLPIILPIVLILLKSISDLPIMPFGNGSFKEVISLVGHPVTALLIGVVAAFAIPKRLTRDMVSVNGWVGEAFFRAGSIILITAAGGAFGKVLQNSGIADIVGTSLSKANLGIWLPAIIAAILKTAQGSSTVAIITTASLLSPLMDSLGFSSPIAKALIVVAIGAGSMIASHANDSYFWVVTQSSKMDVKIGYKLHTLGTLLQGLASVIAVWVMSLFFID